MIEKNDQLNVVVLLQDRMIKKKSKIIQTRVILSFQPQFIKNVVAAQQLVYNAVIFAYLTHKYYSKQKTLK